MTYFSYLIQMYSILASAGSKVPLLLNAVQKLVADLQDPATAKLLMTLEADLQGIVVAVVGKSTTALSQAPTASAEDIKRVEEHITDLVAHKSKGAALHGLAAGPVITLLQQLWSLLQSNPALMQLVVNLLTNLFKVPVAA